ncbi:MAG: WG repeat-containing protein, partial [Clostridia bacterium]|nr:WG repeat-containing protein [Clostridia bacterium]
MNQDHLPANHLRLSGTVPTKPRLRRMLALLCLAVLLLSLLGGCAVQTSATTVVSSAAATESSSATPATESSTIRADENVDGLYPAYIRKNGAKLWGYINVAGKFVLTPAYGMAADFQTNGLAKVQLDGHSGLIDRQGQWIVEPVYDDIADFSEGMAVAYTWDNVTTSSLLDEKGKVLAQVKGSVSAFENGRALIYAADGSQYYINPKGEKVADYQVLASDLASKLQYDQKFADGLAIIGKSVDYKDVYGLFAADGHAILPQEYAGFERLGDNLFAAARETPDIFWYRDLPKALFDQNGKQLSDFAYYDLTTTGDGLISVSDLHDTYLLDSAGQLDESLGKLPGNGTIELDHGLFKATIDQQLMYFTLAGQLVWQENPVDHLANGWQVNRQKLSPDRFTVIFYPEIFGLSDAAVQTKINETLIIAFDSDAASVNFDGSQAAP